MQAYSMVGIMLLGVFSSRVSKPLSLLVSPLRSVARAALRV